MENNNEENKEISKEDLGKNEIPIQRQNFDVELPDGRTVSAESMNEDQYRTAASLQFLQQQMQELSKHVAEFNLKQDHFRLKQKELEDMIPPDGKPS